MVGNIRGADAPMYLMNNSFTNDRMYGVGGAIQQPESPFPGMGMGQALPYGGIMSPQQQSQPPVIEEDSIRCSCGFSAVINRRLSHQTGLFYEDEAEITGIGMYLIYILKWNKNEYLHNQIRLTYFFVFVFN